MRYVLILGATSDIAQALARCYASRGFGLYLAARSGGQDLEEAAGALGREFGVEVRVLAFDVLSVDGFGDWYRRLNPKPFGVLSLVGLLGEQAQAERDGGLARTIIDTNFTGPALLLELAAQDLVRQRAGFIVGVSSVAGERGRRSNYYYGSAKAGFSAFLSGLRHRLCRTGVQVLTVQMGFVRSRMTAGLRLPPLLTLSATAAAKEIFEAQQRGKDVVYVSALWWWVMAVIRSLPECIFKRLSL